MRKENKGITLIALVITIIILLILAGITINLTIGQRGILNRAQEAGRNYVKAAEEEDRQLSNLLGEMDKKENEHSKYYDGADVVPTDTKYFEFVFDETTKTAKIRRIKEEYANIAGYYSGRPCTASIIDGEKEITEVVIPYSVTVDGQKYTITELEKEVFYHYRQLNQMDSKFTNIILPNTIIKIGDSVFYGCRNLNNVNISNSVTSIGNQAFESCTNLINIVIPNSVTSIGYRAFGECINLSNIIILNSVTSIGQQAFESCRNLTNIVIPNSVTSIGNSAFRYCTNLTITLEKGSTLEISEDKWGAKEVIREQ